MNGSEEIQKLLEALDFREIDQAIDMSFGELLWDTLSGKGDFIERLGNLVFQVFMGEWERNKNYLIYILLLGIAFSLLKNFALVFEKSYVSNVCFLLVYGLLMVLLMKSILVLNSVVEQAIQVVIDFMTAFIPVFATTVVVSKGNATAMGFYELGFLVVYVMQWVLSYGMIPLIRMYVVMGLINYVVEEGRFSKLTDLLENIISWALKMLTSIVLGLNIIRNAIAPVGDTFARQTLRKSLAFVPGIGSTLTAISDLFLAAGDVIRGGIGATALIVLIAIVAVPMVKVGVMSMLYRILAVFVEPITDKRISNAILIASKGGNMLFRILATCVILVFITVAMTTLIGGMR